MKTAEKLVPELRFPGFSGFWKIDNVGKLAGVIDCKHRTPPYVEDGIPVVSPGSIKWGKIDLLTPTKKVTESEYNSLMDHCNPNVGDLIFSRNQSIGVVCYLLKKEKFVLGQDTVLIQADKMDPFFLYFRLQTYLVQCLIIRLSGGSTFSRINLNEIRNLKINITPSQQEQQKIASFLSVVDKKIEKLTRKKELLELYKKGVMQKIFSQEILFKNENGKDYPDWEERRIKEFVIDEKSGMKIGPFGSQLKKDTLVETGYKVYGQENVFLKDFDFGDRFITQTHFNKLKTNEIKSGDFLISTMGTIGKSCIVPEDIQKGIMDSHIIRLRLDKRIICPDFLKQIFLLFDIQKQIKRLSVGGIMDGLSMGIINELKFLVPPSINEQKKIGTFLSTIDKKIEAVQTQLTKTQTFKKGLLQKMFV